MLFQNDDTASSHVSASHPLPPPPAPNIIPGEPKKFTRLMSHKNAIASILKIWLGIDSKNLKLDYEMKNNHFGSLSMASNA